MEFKAVLFDFDYTLGDATEAIVAGFCYAFERMGLERPGREDVRRTVGHVLEDEYTMLTGDADPARRAQFRALYVEKANPLQIAGTQLNPGAAELLRALHEKGVPAGVVSSKRGDTLRAVLEARGVAQYLSCVTGGDQVSRPKPDPEGVLAAAAGLSLPPERVLYCGDTVIDAETAQRAGTGFCAVLNGTTQAGAFAPYPCDHVAPDLWDLKAWLGL